MLPIVEPLHSQIFKERLALDEDGYVVAPDRPGLGVEPNPIFYSKIESLNAPHPTR